MSPFGEMNEAVEPLIFINRRLFEPITNLAALIRSMPHSQNGEKSFSHTPAIIHHQTKGHPFPIFHLINSTTNDILADSH